MTKEDAQRQASDEMGYANGKNYAIPMDKLGEFIDRAMEIYAEDKVKNLVKPDVSGSLWFDEGYSKGYSDAKREAAKEIREHYHPNDC